MVAHPLVALAQVTAPIITRDSEEEWLWHEDEQDYLNPPFVWTDCPSGYAMTHAKVTAYLETNKNISDIRCTKIEGLSGAITVKELLHTMTWRQFYGDYKDCPSVPPTDPSWRVPNPYYGDYCAMKTNPSTSHIIDQVFRGRGYGDGVNICPQGQFIVGVLKRVDDYRTEGAINKNITMLKCQGIVGKYDYKVSVVGLPDNTWVECNAGSAAVGIMTVNHNAPGALPGNPDIDPWITNGKQLTQEVVVQALKIWAPAFSAFGASMLSWILDPIFDLLIDDVDTRNLTERVLFCSELPKLNNASCKRVNAPASVVTRQKFKATASMLNSGQNRWYPFQGYRLGSQDPQDNRTWGINRVNLGGTLGTGGTIAIPIQAQAPASPGTYNFNWKMVQDGVEWFGDKCTSSISVRADTARPTVLFLKPTTSSTYTSTGASINIQVVAIDNSNNVQYPFTWARVVGGAIMASGSMNDPSPASQCPFGVCIKNNITLSRGANEILVSAKDANGNIGAGRLIVTYSPVSSTGNSSPSATTLQGLRAALQSLRDLLESARR